MHNLQGDVIGIFDSVGEDTIVRYTYDEWGKVLTITGDQANTIGQLNPIRYRSYYYDTETGFYYCRSRYYDPEICRWINADGQMAGVGGEILGYNQFAYCFNNPMTLDDSDGNWPKWIKKAANAVKNAVKKIEKTVVKVVKKAINHIKTTFSPANNVKKTHVTTPAAVLNFGPVFGVVGFTSTVTHQNKELGLVHSYSDNGNDSSEYAVGVNIVGVVGADIGVSSETNAFVSAQVTPWVHGKVSLGMDGIGVVVGIDVDSISYDFEIKGGWGLITIFFAPQVVLSNGQLNGASA